MVRFIPFKKEHLEIMDVREHERLLLDNAQHIETLEKSYATTGIIDGRIISCGGVWPFGNGNAQIWQIPSIYVSNHKREYFVDLCKWLFKVREDMDLKRMQTTCIADDLHDTWMKHLGFTHEGDAPCYYNGLTYRYWGRVWE